MHRPINMLISPHVTRSCLKLRPGQYLQSHDTSLPFLLLTQEERKECAALVYAGMEANWLRPVVGSQYPLNKAAQAHHDIIESPGAAGKIVLTM